MAKDIPEIRKKIIIRFILGMAIWIAILLTITFIQSSYSRGLFFLVALGISLAYFIIASFMHAYGDDTKAVGTTYSPYVQVENRGSAFLQLTEIILVPGWVLGSWILGIFSLRK
jgi:hypothetical protein